MADVNCIQLSLTVPGLKHRKSMSYHETDGPVYNAKFSSIIITVL